MMKQEFETQILDIDSEEIIRKLRALGAKEEPGILQKRWVFDILCENEKNTIKAEWVRLRKSGDKSTLTYKNKKGAGLGDTSEIEVEVGDFDKAAEIMSKLSCFGAMYYQENKWKKAQQKKLFN